MPDVRDLEAEAIASTFRPNWRRVGLGIGINFVIIVLLLAVPYTRGRTMARAERGAFARVATCILGGKPTAKPGLSLPAGEPERFAENVLLAPTDWPLVCRDALRDVAPKPAIFLWPAVKQAGADVRAVVKLLDDELVALHRARSAGIGRVPTRPLAALAKLQAGLTLMAKAADIEDDIDEPAIAFDKPLAMPEPARLPLTAAEGATLDLLSDTGRFEALALDGRGVSFLHVEDGKIDRERIKRTSSMRGVLRAAGEPYLIWATPETRCKEREDHCAQRATGIAAYDKGAGQSPTPLWLAAHPAGRVDRVMQLAPSGANELRATLVALGHGGKDLELRRFQFDPHAAALPVEPEAPPLAPPSAAAPAAPAATPAPNGAPADAAAAAPKNLGPPPLGSSMTIALGAQNAPAASVWLAHDGSYVAYAEPSETGVAAQLVSLLDDHALPLALPVAPGSDPWLTACERGSMRFVAYGSSTQLRVVRVEAPNVTEAASREVSVSMPLHPENPALDRVRLVCSERGASFFLLDSHATLSLTSCDAAGSCQAPQALAQGVAAFAAIDAGNGTLLAYSGITSREVRVLTLDATAHAQTLARTPAACWDPMGGMCGVPMFTSDAQRIVLTARDGSDLLAIETSDAGQHFVALANVQMGRALDLNAHDPLQQHRLRKGIQ